MRRNRMRGAIGCLLAGMLLCGCARDNSAGTGNVPAGGTAYVRAVQSGEGRTRTAIGGDALDRTLWTERDTIGIWWRTAGSQEQPAGAVFHSYRIYADEALFTADVPAMPAESYAYYGAYPVPDQVSGTQVTYTLPAEQDGSYTAATGGQSRCDLMIARPVTGGAVTSSEVPPLEFVHQCHVMRVQVPVGRNRLGPMWPGCGCSSPAMWSAR